MNYDRFLFSLWETFDLVVDVGITFGNYEIMNFPADGGARNSTLSPTVYVRGFVPLS